VKNLGLGDLEEIQVHLVLCGCQCGHTRVCPFLGMNVTSGPSPSPGGPYGPVTLAMNPVGLAWGRRSQAGVTSGQVRRGRRGTWLLELPEVRATQIKLEDDRPARNQSSREAEPQTPARRLTSPLPSGTGARQDGDSRRWP
jgi:hypothetical protein